MKIKFPMNNHLSFLDFLSASFRPIQVLSCLARTLPQITWSLRARIWAAHNAAASGNMTVAQPRPVKSSLFLIHGKSGRVLATGNKWYLFVVLSTCILNCTVYTGMYWSALLLKSNCHMQKWNRIYWLIYLIIDKIPVFSGWWRGPCLLKEASFSLWNKTLQVLPEGSLIDDQMSCDPQSPDRGGQLITGQVAFPERTGPRPLLLPATAINTVGIPSPEKSNECFNMYQYLLAKSFKAMQLQLFVVIIIWVMWSHCKIS